MMRDDARLPRVGDQLQMSWYIHPDRKGPRFTLSAKNHLVACMGEFIGTNLFLIFAFGGTNVANTPNSSIGQGAPTSTSGPNTSNLLFIALSFGLSLAVNAWVFFRISGGLFNPAVTLGLVLVGALPPLRGLLISISQIIGGITAAAIVDALVPGPIRVVSVLGGGTSIAQGFFIEVFLTAQLVFTIFMLAAEKHKATFIAPIGIGLSLFIAELFGVYYTGGSLNPVRSFGPAVILGSFPGYHWIYWLGPALGAVIASALYKLFKYLEYETVVPNQDAAKLPRSRSTHVGPDFGGDPEMADTAPLSAIVVERPVSHGPSQNGMRARGMTVTTAATAQQLQSSQLAASSSANSLTRRPSQVEYAQYKGGADKGAELNGKASAREGQMYEVQGPDD